MHVALLKTVRLQLHKLHQYRGYFFFSIIIIICLPMLFFFPHFSFFPQMLFLIRFILASHIMGTWDYMHNRVDKICPFTRLQAH